MGESLQQGALAGGFGWPGAGGDIREETAHAPSPALSPLIILPPCPRPWPRLWFVDFGPDRGGIWVWGFKTKDPRAAPIHFSCPHQTPEPISVALLASGGFSGDLARSRWPIACGAVRGMGAACSLLIFP